MIVPAIGFAAVSAEEAARLKTDLTPFGAERAGNADGTIPAWDGGITEPPANVDFKGNGSFFPDPFTDDKVEFSITAANVDQYADKLSEGVKGLFKKYPDTFRMDVYKTRRTQAAPEWINENTFKNATRAKSSEDGLSVTGGYGGIPFPIPQSAEEIMHNHNLRWWGEGRSTPDFYAVLVDSKGNISTGAGGLNLENSPYHFKDGPSKGAEDLSWQFLLSYNRPPRRKGEILLVKDTINLAETPRAAWQYLPGQRRVRRAPTVAFDTPNPAFSGMSTYDDAYVFNGSLERYDWKIVGKKEIYVPYNNYQFDLVNEEEITTGLHVNPDVMRWELHRVWVVDATLKDGKRHIYGRRTFYVDEDSWNALMADQYDARGNLWRFTMIPSYNAYSLPGILSRNWIYYDFTKETYAVSLMMNGLPDFITFGKVDEKMFSPEAVRRRGRR
jgi:hypothetical protein